MNIVYDEIINNKPIPNGLYNKSLINTYLKNRFKYEYYFPLSISTALEHVSFKKTSDAEKGIFPICVKEPNIINNYFLRSVFDFGIKKHTLKKLINGAFTLVFLLDEEPNNTEQVEIIYKFCKEKKIKNFYIYVNIMPILTGQEKIHRVRYAFRFYRLVIKDITQYSQPDKIDYDEEYTFNVFGRFYHNYDFRAAFIYALLKNNLHKTNLISYNKDRPIIRNFTRESKSIKKICNEIDESNFKKTLNFISVKSVKSTKLSLVIEAYFDNYSTERVYLTEKTFRPIYHKKPFLLLGQKHSLRELRNRGFKTFNHVLDEEYDDMENDLRFLSLLKQTNNINKYSKKHLNQVIDDCKNTVDYNYNHMIKYIKSEIDLLSKPGD